MMIGHMLKALAQRCPSRVAARAFTGVALGGLLLLPAVRCIADAPVCLELVPGAGSVNGNFSVFGRAGDSVWFRVEDGTGALGERCTLWRTDGTPGGTVKVYGGELVYGPTALGDKVLFGCEDEEHGEELWCSDLTSAGTGLLKDLRAGPESSEPYGMITAGNRVFFFADGDGDGQQELWRSDGTADGTVMLCEEGYPDDSSSVVAGDRLFFTSYTNAHGVELWTSDGTSAGTHITRNITSGSVSTTFFNSMCAHDGKLFFAIHKANDYCQLWRSDGTETGTVLVTNVRWDDAYYTSIPEMVSVGSLLFFQLYDGSVGRRLWQSDGTAEGTKATPGAGPLSTRGLMAGAEKVFFTGETASGSELWSADGTEGNTLRLLPAVAPGSTKGAYPGRLYFDRKAGTTHLYFAAADDPHGYELWHSDGTPGGTELLANIYLDDYPDSVHNSNPEGMTQHGEKLFFWAYNDVHGREPWVLPVTYQEYVEPLPEGQTFYVNNSGDVYAKKGFNTARADFAEWFAAAPGTELECGDVLALGSDGNLIRASAAENTGFAGVYATAPGLIGSGTDGQADRRGGNARIPLAATGIVPVKVTAAQGPIQPGDMLSLSVRAGFAARANPVTIGGRTFVPEEAIIGKALQPLASGEGLIRVRLVRP